MKKNMGNPDRITRLLLAVLIAVLYFTEVITGIFGIVLLVIAGILLLTGITGICPAYMLLRINTVRKTL